MLAVPLANAEIVFYDNSNDFFQSTNIIHTEIFENADEGDFPAEFDSFIYDGEGKIGHTTWSIDNAPGFNIPISSFVLYSPAVGIDFLKLKNNFSAIGFDFAAPYNFETIGNTIFIKVTEIDNQVTTYEYIQKDDPNGVWEYYGFVSNVGISQIKVYNDETDGILDDNFVFDNISLGEIIPIPEPTIESILTFFEDSVADGTLWGIGRNLRLAQLRLNVMRWMLERAAERIEEGEHDKACKILNRCCLRCDNEPKPKDLVEGPATEQLLRRIDSLMDSLGCDL